MEERGTLADSGLSSSRAELILGRPTRAGRVQGLRGSWTVSAEGSVQAKVQWSWDREWYGRCESRHSIVGSHGGSLSPVGVGWTGWWRAGVQVTGHLKWHKKAEKLCGSSWRQSELFEQCLAGLGQGNL